MEPRYRLLARVGEGASFESFRGAAGEGPDARPVLIRLFTPTASDRPHAQALAIASDWARSLREPRALSYAGAEKPTLRREVAGREEAAPIPVTA